VQVAATAPPSSPQSSHSPHSAPGTKVGPRLLTPSSAHLVSETRALLNLFPHLTGAQTCHTTSPTEGCARAGAPRLITANCPPLPGSAFRAWNWPWGSHQSNQQTVQINLLLNTYTLLALPTQASALLSPTYGFWINRSKEGGLLHCLVFVLLVLFHSAGD
jgi:hypothetical protein